MSPGSDFKFNVEMYETAPEGNEIMDNVLNCAKNRLNLYEILQKYECHPEQENKVQSKLANSPFSNLLKTGDTKVHFQVRKLDRLSHWILRLAYSKYWEDRNHFISYEQTWFKIRYACMSYRDKLRFLEENDFNLTEVSEVERLTIEKKSQVELDCFEIYYKCDFWEVPHLVRNKMCLLIDGKAYFTSLEVMYWILHKLSCDLQQSLICISKTRLASRTETLLSQLTLVRPPRVLPLKMTFELEEIDEEAKTNFPLCMRFIHEKLREKHHLKHYARLQYGLFLKGIGLTLNDSLNFWREEFLQFMSDVKFRGSYTYSIKYQYGETGRKKQQRTYRCAKIMRLPEEENQVHGCPFMAWDEQFLVRYLDDIDIAQSDVESIRQHKRERNYCKACSCYFQAVNGVPVGSTIAHPNEYYLDSVKAKEQYDDQSDIEDLFL